MLPKVPCTYFPFFSATGILALSGMMPSEITDKCVLSTFLNVFLLSPIFILELYREIKAENSLICIALGKLQSSFHSPERWVFHGPYLEKRAGAERN